MRTEGLPPIKEGGGGEQLLAAAQAVSLSTVSLSYSLLDWDARKGEGATQAWLVSWSSTVPLYVGFPLLFPLFVAGLGHTVTLHGVSWLLLLLGTAGSGATPFEFWFVLRDPRSGWIWPGYLRTVVVKYEVPYYSTTLGCWSHCRVLQGSQLLSGSCHNMRL